MTNVALQVATRWAYKYEPTPAAFGKPFLPFALLCQIFSSCLILEFLELQFKDAFVQNLKKMSEEKKMTEEKKTTGETKLYEEKKVADPFIAGFVESMAKTNTEKITKEIMEGLSEDSGDSDSYDMESGDEDFEDRPWRPSHTIFGKSTIKQSHIDAMRGRYFRDMSIIRVGGDSTTPAPEENEVVIYRSFLKQAFGSH
jgi:hypothetical protein